MSECKCSRKRRNRPTGVGASIIILLSITFILLSAHFIAKAQSPNCGSYDVLIKHLAAKYGEQRIATGVTSTGSMLVVTASKDGSWTMMLVQSDGTACLYASGEGWQLDKPGAPS